MAEGSKFELRTYLKYFLTLKGIFRAIDFCYFGFYFVIASILSGALSPYGASTSLHQSSLGFSAFVAFWVAVGEVVMSLVDILNLSFLQPYAFIILLSETIGHGVAGILLFTTLIATIAYAATTGSCGTAACQAVIGINGAGAFFGFIGVILLGVTVGVYIYLLISGRGTKKSADPV
ncbi:hypothetical protein LOD99_16292 [Oopsacas minuta]|uniref:MARVEL domain-containing protein n=1 Tax=Oopsacas minuta TaxID=111878 RepID=A0AAV7K6U6_9METZ|nr:hypothetical protein LOD99_16292 [Oopsacas minuta]